MTNYGKKKSIFKVVVLGDPTVGKTSILNQFVSYRFSKSYKATVGADFLTKDIKIDDRVVTLQIWDTAGQERFNSLGTAFYRGADCCILVYDVTNQKSFTKMQSWRDEFLIQSNPNCPEKFPFIVMGNKTDLEDLRSVSSRRAQQWCQNYNNMPYYEVSALTGTNIQEAFKAIAKDRIDHEVQCPEESFDYPTAISLVQPREKKRRCIC